MLRARFFLTIENKPNGQKTATAPRFYLICAESTGRFHSLYAKSRNMSK